MPKRPRQPTEDELHTFVTLVRGGAQVDAILAYTGIDRELFDGWMAKEQSDFSRAVRRALGDADLRDMRVIAEAATDSWQAAKARLEVRREEGFRDEFRTLRLLSTHGER